MRSPETLDAPIPENSESEGTEEVRAPVLDFDTVRDWVKEHETLALAGGFALGVFVGVMMRRP